MPAGLTPRLPKDFSDYDLDSRGGLLVVVAGLPGSGKSTLADGLGRSLGIPVFAIDWILGALTPFGGRHFDDLRGVGAEQLTTLALRQMSLGQSVILDTPAEDATSRERWRSLATRAGARFAVIDCVCSDPALHRDRLENRERGIPGWHSRGDWANVQQRLRKYPAWPEDVLRLDAVRPPEENLRTALDYLSAGRSSVSP
ncbi:MAG TPA: ATP-binding protein [Mycobacteriales bacterium]|nr:ATP-binding protein [Mycobacteriales bacterium]